MAFVSVALTKDQFETLQQNITDQVTSVGQAVILAQSGLHYVVLQEVDSVEVDLVDPLYYQMQRMSQLDADSNWIAIVTAINTSCVNRGAPATGTLSERFNAYLENGGNRILVSPEYANLSAEAGFIVDPCYIDPGDAAGCLPGITSSLVPVGTHNVAFSYTITALGTLPIVFTVAPVLGQTGLPSGITFDGVQTISGTTAVTGIFTTTITATNTVGTTTDTLTLTIV